MTVEQALAALAWESTTEQAEWERALSVLRDTHAARRALSLMAADFAPFLNISNPETLAAEYLSRARKPPWFGQCAKCGRELSTEESIRSDFCQDCDPPKSALTSPEART